MLPAGDREGGESFPTTNLSLVAGAGSRDPAVRARSLEALLRVYWRPIYKHVRARWNRSPEDAQDLTQAFFTVALEKEYLVRFDPAQGSFRGFLRVCADRFAANDLRASRREKRGAGLVETLDFAAAERELAGVLPASPDSIDRIFEAEWVRALLTLSLAAFEEACARDGRSDHFRLFARYELREPDEAVTYADLAREHGIPVSTVTNRLHAARRELRRHVLEQLRAITASEEELEAEARIVLGLDRLPTAAPGRR